MLVEHKGFSEISISLSDGSPSKRLRKESPEEVKKRIAEAVDDVRTGDLSHNIYFSANEFEQFSKSLLKK